MTMTTYEEFRQTAGLFQTANLPAVLVMIENETAQQAVRDEMAARAEDITRDLEPYDASPGMLVSPQGLHKGLPALLLRMENGCRYVRSQRMFSVLYSDGTCPTSDGMPNAPHASLIAQPGVIGRAIGSAPIIHDVKVGDVITIDGHRLVITDDRPMNYPRMLPVD